MGMRAFDMVGAVVVTTWVGIVAAFFVTHRNAAQPGDFQTSEVRLEAGESWMFIYGENKALADFAKKRRTKENIESDIKALQGDQIEIGYIHESRSKLTDGWLLEYDMQAVMSLAGMQQPLKTRLKARLDTEARLKQFTAEVSSIAGNFKASGTVKGKMLQMTMDMGGSTRTREVPMRGDQRLSSTAVNELLARGALEVGQTYRQEVFDPVSAGMTSVEFLYHGRHDIESYGIKEKGAYYFEQLVMGDKLDVYISEKGEVIIQELPLRTVAVKQFTELGRLRSRTIRSLLEDFERKELKKKGGALNMGGAGLGADGLGLKGVLELMGAGGGKKKEVAKQTTDATHLGDPLDLKIPFAGEGALFSVEAREGTTLRPLTEQVSARQRALTGVTTGRVLVVQPRSEDGLEPLATFTPDAEARAAMLASTEVVDHQADGLEPITASLDMEQPVKARATALATTLAERIKLSDEIPAEPSASALVDVEEADAWAIATLTIAALRRAGIPARYAFGARVVEGRLKPHVWAQYLDDKALVDLDITTTDRAPGAATVQLGAAPAMTREVASRTLADVILRPARPASPAPAP